MIKALKKSLALSAVDKQIKKTVQKVAHKRNVLDIEQTQNFLKQNIKRNLLENKIQKRIRFDSDFENFAKKYYKPDVYGNKIIDAREQWQIDEEKQYEQRELELISTLKEKQKLREKLTIEEKMWEYESDVNLQWRHLNDFQILLIDQRITQNTNAVRRTNQFKTFYFGGNMNGVIGYGRGVGQDPFESMDNAKKSLYSNLISINLDIYNTLPKPIRARFHRTEITLFPLQNFNSFGCPLYSHIIQFAGINHCKFRVVQRKPNNIALVQCFMKLLTQNLTGRQLAEQHGVKLYETVWDRRKSFIDKMEITY